MTEDRIKQLEAQIAELKGHGRDLICILAGTMKQLDEEGVEYSFEEGFEEYIMKKIDIFSEEEHKEEFKKYEKRNMTVWVPDND